MEKNYFVELYNINVNEHTEQKNDLTYLSWAWAWAEFKKICPDATYEIIKFDGKPYFYDEETGYMCYTKVTAGGITHEMWLPVMDGANKAMKNKPYEYTVKNPKFKYAKLDKSSGKYIDTYGKEQTEFLTKTVEAATMFDINKTLMRCLVKNLAMFGLGLYIYAGEDLPESDPERQEYEKEKAQTITEAHVKAIRARLEKVGLEESKVLKKYNLTKLEDMTNGLLAMFNKDINDYEAKVKKNA